MRLTEKHESGHYRPNEQNILAIVPCMDKLGQLENIEEELGIDLVTLFKALKDGVYYKNENDEIVLSKIEHFVPCMNKQLHTRGKLSIIHGVYSREKEQHFAIKDYGKTWALTKEVLNGSY